MKPRIIYTGTRRPAAADTPDVLHAPMLVIRARPFSESAVRDFADHGANFVFYSSNAVESVAETTRLLHEAPRTTFWAVGAKTAEALAQFGIEARNPTDERFEGLLEELPAGRHISMELENGERSLAEARRDDEVLTVVCYASEPNIDETRSFWTGEPPEWLVFTSPRGFEAFLAHAPSIHFLDACKLAAIGPTTAEAIAELGFEADFVASKPDSDLLIRELLSIDAATG